MLKERLQAELKQAMLARDTLRVDVLKGLKSAILYAEVEAKKREEGLSDEEILTVFKKEAKKRQDAIDLYHKAGDENRAEKEQFEKQIIDAYLPQQLTEQEIAVVVDGVMAELGISSVSKQDIGKIIKAVKDKTSGAADGALIAKIVSAKVQ